MKKNLLLTLLLVLAGAGKAQITLNASYNVSYYGIYLTKLHVSGYKFVKLDYPNMKIDIYNTNHTLFKTINIPSLPRPIQNVSFISEKLFDNDNLIEYAVNVSSPAFPVAATGFYIFKENGTQIMFRDSGAIHTTAVSSDIFVNVSGVFFDGTNTRMRLHVQTSSGPSPKTEIYTLPGSIPCAECTDGVVTGIATPNNPNTNSGVFYPNPVTEQLKLKYELPKDCKNADIKIYDLQDKLIETLQVTDAFDFVYLPEVYNNGLYLYSLNVNGKAIKTEKIILNK
ncbi:MAG: T9SS type A sorting domain-containing protein [Bacteroidota bacterium]